VALVKQCVQKANSVPAPAVLGAMLELEAAKLPVSVRFQTLPWMVLVLIRFASTHLGCTTDILPSTTPAMNIGYMRANSSLLPCIIASGQLGGLCGLCVQPATRTAAAAQHSVFWGVQVDGWQEVLQAPGTHWRLIFTAGECMMQGA